MLHVYAVYEIHKVWTTLGQSIVKNRSVEKTSITAFSDCVLYNHEYTISNKCSKFAVTRTYGMATYLQSKRYYILCNCMYQCLPSVRPQATCLRPPQRTVCIGTYPVFVPQQRV